MKESLQIKLEKLSERYEELGGLMGDPEVIGDQPQFRKLAKEYAEVEPVVTLFASHQSIIENINEAKSMLDDSDPDMREMGQEELKKGNVEIESIEDELQKLMLPRDPNDECNTFLEIRAGTGGDEAAIFAGDLFRMYSKFAENKRWKIEIINQNLGEHGGYREVICRIIGDKVYSQLKFESGAHRVQRVPETESQGRVHTSACTVAILAEVEAIDDITINPNDLRIDTFRSSGAGGQHVNTTDSAIRITHLPTNTVVECQDERSQHKNKASAMSLLQARLLSSAQAAQHEEQSSIRRDLVGSGDRSERIRTYNYPQGRVTDHRINLTLYKLAEIMEGGVGEVIGALVAEHQADLLAAMAE